MTEDFKTVEQWAKEKGHTWQFSAAKAYYSWPEGLECPEHEYDRAVDTASNLSFGYGHKVNQ